MKKIFLCLMLLISTNLFSQEIDIQEPKFRSFFDFGYFSSSFEPASTGGNYLSAGFGYKINEDFFLNLGIIKISSSGNFEPKPLFINTPTTYNATLIIPNFSKDWRLYKKFFITGIVGGALIFENVLLPAIHASSNTIEGIEFLNQGEDFNLGLYGEVLLKYEISKNLSLNIGAKSYIGMYLGLDCFMVGAGIEIRL